MEQEKVPSPETKVEAGTVPASAVKKDDIPVVSPDLQFVNQILKSGGESLKKCYQCATCSVVCNLTQNDKPFPRKEMIHAQWGLKNKLFGNPDIWLCHQCSDCTAYCPRGAKPGEVLNAVRKMSIENYAAPTFLGKALANPGSLIPLLAVPALIFAIILSSLGHLNFAKIPLNEKGQISYHEFLPSVYIDSVFVPIALFAVISLVIGLSRYWKDMLLTAGPVTPKGSLSNAITATIGEIISHKRFEKCNVTKDRKLAHLLVFFSFIGLAITTGWAVLYLYGPVIMPLIGLKPFSWMLGPSPYPLSDPVKWLANVSALALLVGITLVMRNRLKNQEKAGKGGYYDWLFIYIIYAIMATGILSEVVRLSNIAVLAYLIYFTHLIVVFFLFAYAPFSKMAHMVYRATAMVFERQYREGS